MDKESMAYTMIYTIYSFVIQLFVLCYLGYLRILAIMNSTTVITRVQMPCLHYFGTVKVYS